MLILYFSERFWSFECNISRFCVSHHCYRHCVLQYVPPVRKIFDISLVVELLIYSEKCFLIWQNKSYSSICKSIIITSPIGFNIVFTNVDARLKQHCINAISTLCNVVSTLFQRRTLTLYQRCAMLKIRRQILFHFQRGINVILTLIHKVETTLIRSWSVGWVL